MVYCAWCANGARLAARLYPGRADQGKARVAVLHGVAVGRGSQILAGVAGSRSVTPRDPANPASSCYIGLLHAVLHPYGET